MQICAASEEPTARQHAEAREGLHMRHFSNYLAIFQTTWHCQLVFLNENRVLSSVFDEY
jgi:hypothetical protein